MNELDARIQQAEQRVIVRKQALSRECAQVETALCATWNKSKTVLSAVGSAFALRIATPWVLRLLFGSRRRSSPVARASRSWFTRLLSLVGLLMPILRGLPLRQFANDMLRTGSSPRRY